MGQWFSTVLSFAFWAGVQLALKKKWFGSPNSSGHSNSPETLRLGVPMVTYKEHRQGGSPSPPKCPLHTATCLRVEGGGAHYSWPLQSKVLVLQTGLLTARKEADAPGQSSTARHRADRSVTLFS